MASPAITDPATVDPLRLLQEDLKDEDYEQIIQSINRLTTIASALGPARTRNELLPFLTEYIEQDNNDEAHTAIARQLGDFFEFVGGGSHALSLIPLLEKFMVEEEVVVRDAAVLSLAKIIPQLSRADVASRILPTIKHLTAGEWFMSRVSSCGLFSATYPVVSDQMQAELRTIYLTQLCTDDTPMVRKAAFHNLGSFAQVLQKQYLKTDVLPVVKSLATDEVDSMRIYTIECCADLGKKLDASEFIQLLLPLIEGLQDDQSWRVRQQLSKLMPKLCESVDVEVSSKRLLPVFAKLLKDKEAEVRCVSAKSLAGVCGAVKVSIAEHIAPCLEALAVDPVQNVRVAFSTALVELCPHFSREMASKLLVPLIQQMTKDEFHQVRHNIIAKLDVLADKDQDKQDRKESGSGSAAASASASSASASSASASAAPSEGGEGGNVLVNAILPFVLELAKDGKWRVRKSVMEKMSFLATALGRQLFEKKLMSVVIGALSDHVFAIRERACVQIGLIVSEFGHKWATEKFLPQAFQLYDKNTNYLHRMTCLLVVQHSSKKCPLEQLDKHLLPIVINAATDDVPNVRIAASKTMSSLILGGHFDSPVIRSKLEPLLTKLQKDSDVDVAYFAGLALSQLKDRPPATTA